jgi:hypothetical protein
MHKVSNQFIKTISAWKYLKPEFINIVGNLLLFDTPRLGNKKHGREGLNPPWQ